MNARDELVDLIEDSVDDAIYNAADAPPSLTGIVAHHAAEAVLAAGYRKPRTITTREEVEALMDGAVVIDSSGDVSHLRDGFWFSYETSPMSHHRLTKYLPATVLHEGDDRS